MEFAHKANKKEAVSANNYTQLLRNALNGVYFDYEDIGYDCDSLEIDVLDQWLDKAQNYVKQNNPSEAILICKACIEEYAVWLRESDCEVIDYVDESYLYRPFELLIQTLSMQGTDCKALFDYCKSEMQNPKYKGIIYNNFSELFMKLSVMVGSNDFIALQDKLLKEINNKSSWEAKKILHGKIDFYENNNQPDKVWDIIRENLQIEDFREKLTKKLITENKLQEAKKLINDFISKNGDKNLYSWNELKLQIAQKEKDIPEIRRVSFLFIESHFEKEYYKIYKSTFAKEEWAETVEKLIKHYEKRHATNWFSNSIANILKTENQEERLMKYVEKHLNVDELEKYHTVFSSSFPEKTLALFRQTIDKYAQNTGRDIYERIASLFKKMIKIKGGNELVREMITQYRVLYKNRRAMMEIINRF